MQIQVVVRNESVNVRSEILEGKKYLVAPVVLIVEGVHNGSNGPVYYPQKAIAKSPQAWNHKPITIYHPKTENVLEMIETQKVGFLLNSHFKDGKLKADAYLDEEKIEKLDQRVLNALKGGRILEVSTGFSGELIDQDGIWNEESYSMIVKDMVPDHLAILPDVEGACSIADGAGLLRNQAAEQSTDQSKEGIEGVLKKIARYIHAKTENETSYAQTEQLIRKKLEEVYGWDQAFLEEVFDSHFIFWFDAEYRKQGYIVSEEEELVSLDGEPVVVKKKIDYVPVNNEKENLQMDAKTQNEQAPEVKEVDLSTVEAVLNAVPQHVRDALQEGLTVVENLRKELIQTVLNSKDNQFTEDDLAGFNTAQIQKLSALASAKVENVETPPVEETTKKDDSATYEGRSERVENEDEPVPISPLGSPWDKKAE